MWILLCQFEDVTAKTGVAGNGRATWADLNGDGDSDLVIDGRVYLNQQGKTFVQAPLQGAPGSGCVAADFNNDGSLDLYFVGNQGVLFFGDGKGKFRKVDAPRNSYDRAHGAAAADLDNDGWVDLYIPNFEDWKNNTYPFPDLMFRNTKGRFSVFWQAPQDKILPGRGATFCDFDKDGDMDLYVSNYRLAPNFLWVNGGKGKFQDKARELGVAGNFEGKGEIVNGHGWRYTVAGHTIGSAWADFDNDLWFDLLVGNFSHPPATQDRVQLLRNEEGKRFSDKSASAKVRWQESYAGACCGDFDNDGRIDFFIPAVYKGDRGVLYRNLGNWTFQEANAGIAQAESYQAAFGDYDNDGFLDAMIGGKLYRNLGNGNSWIKIALAGKTSNRSAIGARVVLTAGLLKQIRQVEAGTGSGCANDLTLHFGLGDFSGEADLEITWPNGKVQTEKARAKSTVRIEQK